MNSFCPYCEDITSINQISKEEALQVLGEPVKYEATILKCNKCSNEFATPDMEEENFRSAYSIYRRRHSLLFPEEIKEIREKLGLSQRGFGRFLGWGDVTIHRYETGAIQDIAHNETLALLKANCRNAWTILNLNKNNLPEKEVKKIEKRIRELVNQEDRLTNPCRHLSEGKPPGIYSGYKAFNFDKIASLILYITKRFDGVFKTKLNKLLWYCDFKHFKEYSVGITGAEYIHLQYGPVPDFYEDLLWQLQTDKKICIEEVIYEGSNISGEKVVSLDEYENIFNNDEMHTIDYVMKELGSLTASQISDKSHKESGYEETGYLDLIPYKYALDLSV